MKPKEVLASLHQLEAQWATLPRAVRQQRLKGLDDSLAESMREATTRDDEQDLARAGLEVHLFAAEKLLSPP
jgi:hypothetical protein